jgi:hypothetical protein
VADNCALSTRGCALKQSNKAEKASVRRSHKDILALTVASEQYIPTKGE